MRGNVAVAAAVGISLFAIAPDTFAQDEPVRPWTSSSGTTGAGLGLRPDPTLGEDADPLDDEGNQFAFEPYLLATIGSGFFLARFTYNIEEPLGPSFDDERIWGVHVGGGGAF